MPETLEEFAQRTMKEMLKEMPVEERLEGLSPEQRMKGLSLEDCVKGHSAEELEQLLRRIRQNGGQSPQE